MENSIVIIFNIEKKKKQIDLEIPTDISANDLVMALNEAFDLGIDISDQKECFLKAENPFTLIRGGKKISELGLRNGTIINFTE